MDWLGENWLWLAVFVLFVWMHGRMHAGHGSHGRGCGHGNANVTAKKERTDAER